MTAFLGRTLLTALIFGVALMLAAVVIPAMLPGSPVLGFLLAILLGAAAVTASDDLIRPAHDPVQD